MPIAILQHTPTWVWIVLAALVAFGLTQARDRSVSSGRATLLPVALAVLSAVGVLTAFGAAPAPVAGWLLGLGGALLLGGRALAVRGATWSASTSTFQVPGSWVPLVLMLGLFAIKFFVGAHLSLDASLGHDPVFAGLCSLAYGAFAGSFLARSMSLRRLAGMPGSLRSA